MRVVARLNALLAAADFDRWVEARCASYYARHTGRPGIPPGVYFRMLMVGYLEGHGSERGIAWRCADSLSLREFLERLAPASSISDAARPRASPRTDLGTSHTTTNPPPR